MRAACFLAFGLLCLGATASAAAPAEKQTDQETIVPAQAVRAGQLVFLTRTDAPVTQSRVGDELTLTPAVRLLDRKAAATSGALTVHTTRDHTVIRLRPAATVTVTQTAGRLVLEIGSAAAGSAPTSAPMPVPALAPGSARTAGPASPSPPTPAGGTVLPGLPAPMIAVVEGAGQATAAKPAAETIPAPAASLSGTSPVSIEAALVPSTIRDAAQLLLPFDRTVGAAAFRRGGRVEVVFDARKPIDLSASAGDPAFQQARLTLLPAGTLLDMPCDPSQTVALRRVPEGWLLTRAGGAAASIPPESTADGLNFPMANAGEVLTVADPAGGGDLLVGTSRGDMRAATGSGRAPGYRMVPALLGVVVERLSDRVELRAHAAGFRLIDPFAPAGGYRTDPASSFSRVLDMSPVDRAEQWRRYKFFLATSASLPVPQRRSARLDAARAALALGFGADAHQLADIADQDAPDGAGRSASAFLIGAGALLSGDADAERLLADPVIGNSDEASLWRSLAVARVTPNDPAALRSIAAGWRLLQSYPAPIRRQLIGDAALALARNGNAKDRQLVASLSDQDGKAAMARALVGEGPDHDKPALAMLDRLFADRDPDVSLSAALEAVDLRLRDGAIGVPEAAKRTEQLIYDGRMAGRELEVAIRAAQLRARSGNFPAAMAILREQAQATAQMPGGIPPELKQAAGAVLTQAAGAAPDAGADKTNGVIDAAALFKENEDLLPPDLDRTALTTRIADHLATQDLPGRATGFLKQAFDQSPPGAEKAKLGLALGEALLQQDDPKGAAVTLQAIQQDGSVPVDPERATYLRARILQAQGDGTGAVAVLADRKDPQALALKASILGDSKDWRGQAAALSDLLAAEKPGGPDHSKLSADQQALVMRLAGALSRAGQADAVRQLNQTWSPSFSDRSERDMLALLAAPDVNSVSDLPRSARDLSAARSALKVLSGGPG